MMNCPTCDKYEGGKGTKDCLKCKKYMFFVLQSGKRSPIVFEHIPEAIYENIANPDIDDKMPGLINGMRRLPIDLSIVMACYYILGMKQREIAKILNTSLTSISRKLTESVEQLKKIISQQSQ
jgi:DNA-directed RNA polymerase specialized sigma subunit